MMSTLRSLRSEENVQSAEKWLPSEQFSNTSSVDWFSRKNDENFKTVKSLFGHKFSNQDLEVADRSFNDYANVESEFGERDDYKAIPFQVSEQTAPNIANNQVHFHSTLFSPQSASNGPKPFYIASAPTASSYSNGATNFVSSPLSYSTIFQSSQAPSQNLETFDSYLPPAPSPSPLVNNVTSIELNTRHRLYLQPGKCSNSIEVGRLRDLEIKSTIKYGSDTQKAVCVLMLYAVNENNKLAISMQSAEETISAELTTENWLESNIKIYALHGGTIMPISIELVHAFLFYPISSYR